MKKIVFAVLSCLLLVVMLFIVLISLNPKHQNKKRLIIEQQKVAKSFLEAACSQNYQTAYDLLADEIKVQITSPELLKVGYDALNAKYGSLDKILSTRSGKEVMGDGKVRNCVIFKCKFARDTTNVYIFVNDKNKILSMEMKR